MARLARTTLDAYPHDAVFRGAGFIQERGMLFYRLCSKPVTPPVTRWGCPEHRERR